MRILYVTEGHLERRNGTTAHIKGLISGMRSAGIEVHTLVRRDDGAGAIEVPEVELPLAGTLLSQGRMLDVGLEYARRRKFDLILGRVEYQSIAAVELAKRLCLPLVADLNGDLSFQMSRRSFRERMLFQYVEPRFLRAAARILVTSSGVAERVGVRLNLDQEKFSAVPMGIDESFFASLCGREEARRKLFLPIDTYALVFTGHLNEWQGVESLIELAGRIEDAEAWIFGDGPARNALERLAIGKPVKFFGESDMRSMPLIMSAADILIQPPRHEAHVGMPTRMAEYLASGRPVLASDRHATERDFARKSLITTVDFDEPSDVLDVIRGIRASAPFARAAAASDFARQELLWPVLGNRLRRLFEELARAE